ncbi:MAG: MBOAT family O-acyltransferase [Bdellovibrionota bacterium]
MVFHSLAFVPFIAAFFACYFIARKYSQHQKVLILFSCIFYGWWDWRCLGLLALTVIIDYFAAIKIEDTQDKVNRKRWLWLSIGCNLAILFIFKYFNFFSTELVGVLNFMGMSLEPIVLNLILPIGLSYYTFQSMGYTIDVYRGEIKAERDAISFTAFVSFFPQLQVGPIEKASRLLPQIKEPKWPSTEDIQRGLFLILVGYFKKIVIAERLHPFVNSFYDHPSHYESGWTFIIASYFLFIFVYCDFSGYCNIASGLARIMGIRLMDNFLTPFAATTPSDFFQRWHISMTQWIKSYILYPLALWSGRIVPSLFVALFVMGLWHGASLNFVLWGMAVFLMTMFFAYLGRVQKKADRKYAPAFHLFRHVFMKTVFIFFSSSLIRIKDLKDGYDILRKIAGSHSLETFYGDISRNIHFPGLGISDYIMSVGLITGLLIFQNIQGKRPIEDYILTKPRMLQYLFVGCLVIGLLFFRPLVIDDRYFYFQF